MKRTLLFFTTLALCAVSCGTVGTYADSDRFQDGIYYKPDPTNKVREPLSEDEFRYLASLDNFNSQRDTSRVPDQTVEDTDSRYDVDSYWYSWYPYGYWHPYHYSYWGYYSPYWSYSPYYWGYSWGYDPYWWDYGRYPGYYYGYPYHYGYGRPYHHYYGQSSSATRVHRDGSATSGHYSRPGGYHGTGVTRTASSMAKHDIDRIKVGRSGPKTTAVNRDTGYSETSNYRSSGATRSNSAASYRSSSSTSRYESSSSSRTTTSSSRSSSYSGGGHSGSSHSSSSSHSSGGGGYHGGGHR